MKTLGLFETKNQLSEVCDEVARTGEPCLITRHGLPLVRLVPAAEESRGSVWDTVRESAARYGAIDEGLPLPERNVVDNRISPL